jgi:hypothetical protein
MAENLIATTAAQGSLLSEALQSAAQNLEVVAAAGARDTLPSLDDTDRTIPAFDQVTACHITGTNEVGFLDGEVAAARFDSCRGMHLLRNRCVLVADEFNHCVRMLSADLQQVSTAVGDGEAELRDGAAEQARFNCPTDIAGLPDGRVLVVDSANNLIRVLSADLQQVSTVAGDGEEGYQDGAAAEAQFDFPQALAVLPDGRVLVADAGNRRVRMLSADLQQVSTVTGDGIGGNQDGAATQARLDFPQALVVLSDGRVLISDSGNRQIRMLSADLQEVSTVAGDGGFGHRDGAAAQAQFHYPDDLLVLPNGSVLLVDSNEETGKGCIRVLNANLQEVRTLTSVGEEVVNPSDMELLPDGRVLVADDMRVHIIQGFPAAALGAKPAPKPPKEGGRSNGGKKHALAGGANAGGSSVGSCAVEQGPAPVAKRRR